MFDRSTMTPLDELPPYLARIIQEVSNHTLPMFARADAAIGDFAAMLPQGFLHDEEEVMTGRIAEALAWIAAYRGAVHSGEKVTTTRLGKSEPDIPVRVTRRGVVSMRGGPDPLAAREEFVHREKLTWLDATTIVGRWGQHIMRVGFPELDSPCQFTYELPPLFDPDSYWEEVLIHIHPHRSVGSRKPPVENYGNILPAYKIEEGTAISVSAIRSISMQWGSFARLRKYGLVAERGRVPIEVTTLGGVPHSVLVFVHDGHDIVLHSEDFAAVAHTARRNL